MTIKFLNEDIRCELIERYADHFVNNVSLEMMKRMVWDQIYDDYHNYNDSDLLWEIQMNAPELLGLPELADLQVRSCNY
jgi:hypothetical protein